MVETVLEGSLNECQIVVKEENEWISVLLLMKLENIYG